MSSPLQTASILIVEDDLLLAQNIAMQLTQLGYGIAGILASGEDAIAQTSLLKPDLILIDILLAGNIDGIEAARKIHLTATVPVIFLTAYTDQDLIARAVATGPFAYLQKPLKERELELSLELALLRHRMEQMDQDARQILEKRVSQSKQAIDELETRQQRTQSSLRRFIDAMDVSADSIFLIDRINMRFIDVNITACEQTGYSKSELLEMGPQDIEPNATRHNLEHQLDRIAASHERFGIINTQHRCKSGALIPVEIRMRTMESEARPTVIAVARDMTVRQQNELALRQSEEQFRLLFENSPIGLGLVFHDRRLVEANAALCQMLGYSQHELIGKTLDEITHPDDLPLTVENMTQLFHSSAPVHAKEMRHLHKNGTPVWCRLNSTIVRDHNHTPLFALEMIENIDQIKQVETVRIAQESAQKKALVREIHHRIKNHLQGVVGLMQQHAQDDVQCNSTIAAAIEQINVVATIHGLQGKEASEDLDLLQMLDSIRQALVTVSPACSPQPVRIEQNYSLRLNPDESVPLALALNELMVNACKHGTGSMEISLTCSDIQAVICINNPCSNTTASISRGSGLKLVHALLQTEGIAFRHEITGQHFRAEITLNPPVIHLS